MVAMSIDRRLGLLRSFLEGRSLIDIANEFQFTTAATASGAVRTSIEFLNNYSEIQYPVSSSYEKLSPHKADMMNAIENNKMPKVPIGHTVHHYLKGKFGHDYPKKAKEVAEKWDELSKDFWRGYDSRDRNTMRAWLASEGYFVGNYLTDKETRFVMEVVSDKLKGTAKSVSQKTVTVKDCRKYDNELLVEFDFNRGDGKVTTRKIQIQVMPLR